MADCATDVADGVWTLAPFDGSALAIARPPLELDGRPWTYVQHHVAAPPYSVYAERDLYGPRWTAVQQFIAANAIDGIEGAVDDAWLGIVAPGKTSWDS